MQTIEQWMEWKTLCALDLCREDTRRSLQGFAYSRYTRFAATYANTTNVPDPKALTPDAPEAWHGFETHFQIHKSREGKSYKEWLFARAPNDEPCSLESIHCGAALLLRDVVRERFRQEFSQVWMESLDAPSSTAQDRSIPSLYELLPGPTGSPADAAIRHELEELATRESDGAMAALSRRECIALLARELGLSLAHPAVVRLAECGKTVLHDVFRDALAALTSHVRSRFPREDNQTIASLACMVYEQVRDRIIFWGKKPENQCAQLFLLVKKRVS